MSLVVPVLIYPCLLGLTGIIYIIQPSPTSYSFQLSLPIHTPVLPIRYTSNGKPYITINLTGRDFIVSGSFAHNIPAHVAIAESHNDLLHQYNTLACTSHRVISQLADIIYQQAITNSSNQPDSSKSPRPSVLSSPCWTPAYLHYISPSCTCFHCVDAFEEILSFSNTDPHHESSCVNLPCHHHVLSPKPYGY